MVEDGKLFFPSNFHFIFNIIIIQIELFPFTQQKGGENIANEIAERRRKVKFMKSTQGTAAERKRWTPEDRYLVYHFLDIEPTLLIGAGREVQHNNTFNIQNIDDVKRPEGNQPTLAVVVVSCWLNEKSKVHSTNIEKYLRTTLKMISGSDRRIS